MPGLPYKLSVKQVAAFSGRQGDLAGGDREQRKATAREGITAQQALQDQRPRDYQREVSIQGEFHYGGQLMAPGRRLTPILYYAPETGIGIALDYDLQRPKRVGVL